MLNGVEVGGFGCIPVMSSSTVGLAFSADGEWRKVATAFHSTVE